MKQFQHKHPTSKRKKIVITVAVVVSVYAISLFIPYVRGYTLYPLYFIKCGKQPIVATDFAASKSYYLPGDSYYGIIGFNGPHYCTEEEAQADGRYRLR